MAVRTVKGSREWEDRLRFQMTENENEHLQVALWPAQAPQQAPDTTRRNFELTIESPDLESFLRPPRRAQCEHGDGQCQGMVQEGYEARGDQHHVRPPGEASCEAGAKPSVKVKVKAGKEEKNPASIFVVRSQENGHIEYTRGNADDLQRNCKCLVVVETSGLWFMSRQFGMSLTASEIMVWPTKRVTGIDAFTLNKPVRQIAAATEPVDLQEDEMMMDDEM